jgi:hypothetical protein
MPDHVHLVECGSEALRIDMKLLRVQRELLAKVVDLARKSLPYTPTSGDARLLDGLLELTDTVYDMTQAGSS